MVLPSLLTVGQRARRGSHEGDPEVANARLARADLHGPHLIKADWEIEFNCVQEKETDVVNI